MKNPSTDEIPTPQTRLAAGVLAQARRDLRRFHGATRSVERELYLDAYDWINSEDFRWPFSFRNVCQILNLSPESVRHELFHDVALGAFQYWSRRFGYALRGFHTSLRHIAINEHGFRSAGSRKLAHTVS